MNSTKKINMDTEKNTITYISNGSEVTFSYGDM